MVLRQVHARRMIVLQNKLMNCFIEMYPEFEAELRFFVNKSRSTLLSVLTSTYTDQMIIHHHHYFPDMPPLGMAHHSCNIKTYTKGVPTPLIYVHNLTNYDSNFLLKMIPPYVMAHKGKNTSNQWSVIAPPGNKNKIKLMMTPFGTFSDSMNFFINSLADMAKDMIEEDVKQLYMLHLRYFESCPCFKSILKRRDKEGKPFTCELFKSMFKGKLIFPYDAMDDLNWLMVESDTLPPAEDFMNNRIGTADPEPTQYEAMAEIYT